MVHGRYALPLWGLMMALLCAPALSQQLLNPDERQAIRSVIQAQLDAFQEDDAETAFSFATPGIQARFRDPETFMTMVRTGYEPVYRPGSVLFQELVPFAGSVAQQVLITDRSGRSVMAIYPMEQQDDGSWRIAGCYLRPAPNRQLL
jgi:hypothetical protein